jgi:hypothetical protein
MTGDFFAVHERLGRRSGCRLVPLAVLFWTLLWPVGTIWLVVSLVRRYRALDKSHDAKTARRVERFLSWYPTSWRARYGEEFSDLLHQDIADGHGGLRLTLNVVREANAARMAALGSTAAAVCWSLFWLPLFAQGVDPLITKLRGSPSRSWFLALYTPAPYQWLVIALMISTGLTMFVIAMRYTVRQASA